MDSVWVSLQVTSNDGKKREGFMFWEWKGFLKEKKADKKKE